MSDQEEQDVASEEEEDQQEQQEDSEGDQEEEEDGSDAEENSNEDEDQEKDQEDEDEEDQKSQSKEDAGQTLPRFKSIAQPEEFKFHSLLAEISNLSVSVDNFINTLPSHGGINQHSRYSYSNRMPFSSIETPIIFPPREQKVSPKTIVMKDQDIQVSMQPQIIIQPTKVHKEDKQSYKMSNQSTKFLAQLYEENKKLKRWQNSSHQVNGSASSGGFYNSRERFERKEYEKGLFNVQERNKEIDEAIEMLKREEEN